MNKKIFGLHLVVVISFVFLVTACGKKESDNIVDAPPGLDTPQPAPAPSTPPPPPPPPTPAPSEPAPPSAPSRPDTPEGLANGTYTGNFYEKGSPNGTATVTVSFDNEYINVTLTNNKFTSTMRGTYSAYNYSSYYGSSFKYIISIFPRDYPMNGCLDSDCVFIGGTPAIWVRNDNSAEFVFSSLIKLKHHSGSILNDLIPYSYDRYINTRDYTFSTLNRSN